MNLIARIARLEREAPPLACPECAGRVLWPVDHPGERPCCEACGRPMPDESAKPILRAMWEEI